MTLFNLKKIVLLVLKLRRQFQTIWSNFLFPSARPSLFRLFSPNPPLLITALQLKLTASMLQSSITTTAFQILYLQYYCFHSYKEQLWQKVVTLPLLLAYERFAFRSFQMPTTYSNLCWHFAFLCEWNACGICAILCLGLHMDVSASQQKKLAKLTFSKR